MPTSPQPRLYVDFDDVLSQTARAFIRLLDETVGKRVEFEEITSFDLSKSFALGQEEIDAFMVEAHKPERLIGVEPIEGAIDTLQAWHDRGCRIDVLTGRPPSSERVSRDWLERHEVPHEGLYFVDKYTRYDDSAWHGHAPVLQLDELHGDTYDLVIEDSLKTASYLAEHTSARVLLLDRPWNRDVSELEESTVARIERCKNWHDVAAAFP